METEDFQQASQPKRDKPLILVVEDMAVQVMLTRMSLERGGYDVLAARDGVEALERVETHKPDLILLDVDIPGLNGFQVLDRLRSDTAYRSIPVIMLTAHAKDAELFQEWAGARDAFMAKPFTPTELVKAVGRSLQSVSNRASEETA